MKPFPKVLIMGRPNVGKSTLINRILGKRKAIVEDTPGVTRDLAQFQVDWNGIPFVLVDSGGVFFSNSTDIYLQEKIEEKVRESIQACDKVVLLADYTAGSHPLDKVIAQELRPYQHKLILAVNKIDNPSNRYDLGEYYALGGDPVPISSLHGNGVGDLLDKIVCGFEKPTEILTFEKDYRVAIVGRPNVGKSSLVNALINEERMLVDDYSGTTRDSVEIYFEYQHKKYIFIDTAGIRRKSKVDDGVEYFSVLRSNESIQYADLVIVLMEANEFLTDQDKKIISFVQKKVRNMIIFVNKWDLTDRSDQKRREFMRYAGHIFPALKNVPFIFGSAVLRHNLSKLFQLIPQVVQTSEFRIPTADLNRFVSEVLMYHPPSIKGGKPIRIFYGTQTQVSPPEFVFFINYAQAVNQEYVRFVENRIREHFGGFLGVPIKISFRKRTQKKGG